MTNLPMHELRDINIEAVDPMTVMVEVMKQIEGLKNKTVMLFSKQYSYNECAKMINSTWKPEYHQKLKENNINLEIVVLKQQYEHQDKKKLVATI